jgi:NitT/TauT family transport system permease protein
MSAQTQLRVAEVSVERAATEAPALKVIRPMRSEPPRPSTVWFLRIAIVVVSLVVWEYVPQIAGIRGPFPVLDPFFISSPSRLAVELGHLFTGSGGQVSIWEPLAVSVLTALAGTIGGALVGIIAGLAVSNWPLLDAVSRPFLVVLNAIPRIALIPIIVLIVGGSWKAGVLTSGIIVFFLIFYNAHAGASSVSLQTIQNAELLGSSKLRVMFRVRFPYALAWTMAQAPNAVAHGLVGTITGELFIGGRGMGYLMALAIDNQNATLLFGIVTVLAVIGVILVLGSSWLSKKLLPWWETSQGA